MARREQTLNWWLGLVLLLLSVGIVYFTLYQTLSCLFRRHRVWFFAVLILMTPFGFVLAQVTSLLGLVWVLALTPFYGIFVLFMVATTWMVRYYCAAFAFLMLTEFLLHRRTLALANENAPSFEPFWQKHLKAYSFGTKRMTALGVANRRISPALSRVVRRYWTLAMAIALVVIAASTIVNASVPRNPTYAEAAGFVASDKTDTRHYTAGTYTCADFAKDFQSSALKAGLSCGIVTTFFPDETSHDLDCFNTTDRGVIYVEPQTDQIVSLTVGQVYSGPGWNMQMKNATVVGFFVTWQP
jgi:hypothetical protein